MSRRIMRRVKDDGVKRVCELCGEKVTKKTRLVVGCKECRPNAKE